MNDVQDLQPGSVTVEEVLPGEPVPPDPEDAGFDLAKLNMCEGCQHPQALHVSKSCAWADKLEDGTEQPCGCAEYKLKSVPVQMVMVPASQWQCPLCKAPEMNFDPKIVQALARANVLQAQCGRCSQVYQITRPLIIQPNLQPNRHDRRSAAATARRNL